MAGKIVRAAIHPAIGLARVGNSTTAHLVAPQVTTPPPRSVGSSHDAEGFLKREAVEFRIYGYDAQGAVVAELTLDNADVEWTAHVANSKAAWYKFRAGLDVKGTDAYKMERRNPKYDPARRGELVIDPGPRSIAGRDRGGDAAHIFDTGTFQGQQVYLGELRTDGKGRLLFLGGLGRSFSPQGLPAYDDDDKPDPFGNATGWCDDIADGPVDARVRIDGQDIPTEGAWVVSAPPNYAPDVVSWRTLHDLLVELYIDAEWITPAATVSFTRDVYPILARLTGLQWVNSGFASVFGVNAPFDFTKPQLIDKIAKIHGGQSDVYAPLRRRILRAFRPQGDDGGNDAASWPWIYGDGFDIPPSLPQIYLPMPPRWSAILERWSRGDFVADWTGPVASPTHIDQLPLERRPEMLDRAALHFGAADAFHPGIELTWPMRHLSLYGKPFRINRRPINQPPKDYGAVLTPAIALAPDGPLHAQGPGDLSRWMLVPWQVDTAGCRSGYDRAYDPWLPTFWPSRVPNQVLTAANYDIVIDSSKPRAQRLAALQDRRNWYFPLEGHGGNQLILMVSMFASMGVVEARRGPVGDPDIPETLYVESLPPADAAGPVPEATFKGRSTTPEAHPEYESARAAGWESVEQLEFIRRARFGH